MAFIIIIIVQALINLTQVALTCLLHTIKSCSYRDGRTAGGNLTTSPYTSPSSPCGADEATHPPLTFSPFHALLLGSEPSLMVSHSLCVFSLCLQDASYELSTSRCPTTCNSSSLLPLPASTCHHILSSLHSAIVKFPNFCPYLGSGPCLVTSSLISVTVARLPCTPAREICQ